jgi:tRNA A-37 threonylcarbamoyl transferase component Bud32
MHRVPPLGQLLVTAGLLSQRALEEVLSAQKTDGRRLGELLAEQGLVRPHQLAQCLSHQLACPWVSLDRVDIAPEAVETLPRDLALKHHMVPVHLRASKGATALYVAMDDPTDDVALAEARVRTGMAVKPMVALVTEIRAALERLYRASPASQPLSRPAKPPPPKKTLPPSDALEEIELLEEALPPSGRAQVLIVDPSERIVRAVRSAFAEIGVECRTVQVSDLARTVEQCAPALIVVDDGTYESARAGVDKVALGTDARLVVASGQVGALQLGAFAVATFTQRASYEKGTIIDGRYELVRELGGRVPGSRWEVRHLRTNRRATIKIGVSAHRDDSDAEAVRREAAALARLRHPSIIDVRDAGHTDLGDPFLVLEPLEGRTLEGLVAARGALEMRSACALLKDVADALAAAHEAGILHHEVSPEHVVVSRDERGAERAKLVQWEAASIAEGAVEPSIDLAGLAACAFLALVGRERHDGENVSHTEELEPDLAHVIASGIGGAHARRYDSVRAFANALADAMPTGERTTLLDARPQQEGRRHRRVWYRTPVRVEIPSVGAIDGRTEDVSEGGIFVVTRSRVPEGVPVTIRFALPLDGKVVSETGIVRWSRAIASDESERPGATRAIGIELVRPGEESLLQLARFVAGA